MQIDEALDPERCRQVLAEVGRIPPVSSDRLTPAATAIFTCANEAVAAASEAYEQLPSGAWKTANGSSTTSAGSPSTSASNWARWRWRRPRSAGSSTRSRS